MANTPRLGIRLLEPTDVANYEAINTIFTLIDNLVAKQDTLNGTTGHAHNGTDGNGPKIPYANITGTPASLPANGGNADTVDSKHAADFAAAAHTHADATTSASGLMSGTDKSNLNTLVTRVNQSLTTTASPTFAAVTATTITATKVTGAVYA